MPRSQVKVASATSMLNNAILFSVLFGRAAIPVDPRDWRVITGSTAGAASDRVLCRDVMP